MVKAVIFDMDGVLVDSEPFFMEASRENFKGLGIEISSQEHHSFVGLPYKSIWTKIKDKFHLPHSVEELIEQDKEIHYHSLKKAKLEPINGIVHLLKTLKDMMIPLAIASSAPRNRIELVLSKTGLEETFSSIISGEELKNGKPHPEIFLTAASGINHRPEDCLVIEDSPHGIAGAKAANMFAVGHQNLNSGNQDLSKADLVIGDFSKGNRMKIVDLIREST